MKTYLNRHAQVLVHSSARLLETPFATFMTVAMLGVALALPAILFFLTDNMYRATSQWDARPQLSLFLQKDLEQPNVEVLMQQIGELPGVHEISYVSPGQALEEFKQLSGFGAALDLLGENPLPGIVVVFPDAASGTVGRVQSLRQQLSDIAGVGQVQVDLEWVQRLNALLKLSRQTMVILAVLLGAGVVLIISNTVRLAIVNRRDEIEIIDQIGGTRAFIQRPFLYTGLLLGLVGAIFACVIVLGVYWSLAGPVGELAQLYGSDFRLHGMNLGLAGGLMAGSSAFGWLAARVTVWRHLQYLAPG